MASCPEEGTQGSLWLSSENSVFPGADVAVQKIRRIVPEQSHGQGGRSQGAPGLWWEDCEQRSVDEGGLEAWGSQETHSEGLPWDLGLCSQPSETGAGSLISHRRK